MDGNEKLVWELEQNENLRLFRKMEMQEPKSIPVLNRKISTSISYIYIDSVSRYMQSFLVSI